MAQVQRYHQMEILKESEFSNLASLSFQMLVFPVSYVNFQFVCLHKFHLQLLVFLQPFLWAKHLLSRTVTPGTVGLSPETVFSKQRWIALSTHKLWGITVLHVLPCVNISVHSSGPGYFSFISMSPMCIIRGLLDLPIQKRIMSVTLFHQQETLATNFPQRTHCPNPPLLYILTIPNHSQTIEHYNRKRLVEDLKKATSCLII